MDSRPADPHDPEEPARDALNEPEDPGSEGAEEPVEEPAPPPPRVNPIVAGLRRDLAERDEQLRGYITAYKQAKADMERERERMARERDQVADRERANVAARLLEVLDNLDRSAAGCKPGANIEDVATGLELVRRQFFDALVELGAERIEAVGAPFDAQLHEATGMIPAQPGQADQEVVFEQLPGYTFKGKLLRAARVVVASRSD